MASYLGEVRFDSYCGNFCASCENCLETGEYFPLGIDGKKQRRTCYGCKSDHWDARRSPCKLKECARKRGIEFCVDCDEFPCKDFIHFENARFPHLPSAIGSLGIIKAFGLEVWLDGQNRIWKCPECGAYTNRFIGECPQCGFKLPSWWERYREWMNGLNRQLEEGKRRKIYMSRDMIATIRNLAEMESLRDVLAFVHQTVVRYGLEESQAVKLEIAVEEALVNVIQHAFDPDEKGYYDVIIEKGPATIQVSVADKGLPYDFSKLDHSEGGLGVKLMKGLVEEVRFLSMGIDGKRIEFVKQLPHTSAEDYIEEEPKELPMVPPETKTVIRLIEPGDTDALARCIYRSYGYSYAMGFIYYPEKTQDLLDRGLLRSVVVIGKDGELVGHLGLSLPTADAKVGESGMAVVDPRYRGRGLFKHLKNFLIDHARESGMYGIYSEAVAVHPFTQKGNLTLGANETGIVLGLMPPTMHFRKIQSEEAKERQSAVLFYLKLHESPKQYIYPPLHHKSMIDKIYERNGLERVSTSFGKIEINLPEFSKLTTKIILQAKIGYIVIQEYGEDLIPAVRHHLHEMAQQKMEVVNIDLPLKSPAAAKVCASLEMLGFFFAGVIPELYGGDVLRLQYMNMAKVGLDKIVVVSDFAKELLEYVKSAYLETYQ